VLEDAGVAVPIPAFADHTVHLTPGAARALFAGLPLDIVEAHYERQLRGHTRRRATDLITALFFKNALFQMVAVRTLPRPASPS
jgi:hypothetical protein